MINPFDAQKQEYRWLREPSKASTQAVAEFRRSIRMLPTFIQTSLVPQQDYSFRASASRTGDKDRSSAKPSFARSVSMLAALLLASGSGHAADSAAENPAPKVPIEELASPRAPLASQPHGSPLRDGDVIYLFGDSNLEWTPAAQTLRIWLRMRFPRLNIQVINAGVAGSNASESSYTRLQSDLFDTNRPSPTRVFVSFGLNDILWGKAQGKKRERLERFYIDGIERISREVKAKSPDTKVYIMSYPPVTVPEAAALKKDPGLKVLGTLNADASGQLNVLTREGMSAGERLGAETIDLNSFMRRTMGKLRENGKPKYHRPDGVHLNEKGADHVVAALLRGLDVPHVVSSVTIDAKEFRNDAIVTVSEGARISSVSTDLARGRISFVRDDDGLPFVRAFYEDGKKPVEDFSRSPLREFTQYLLKVENLPAGHYAIRVGGDGVTPGRVISPKSGISTSSLAAGVDLAYMGHDAYAPSTPWAYKSRNQILLADDKWDKLRLNSVHYAAEDPAKAADLRLIEENRVREHEAARTLAQPYPIHFSIERVGD